MKHQAAQDRWSSPYMWSACNKIVEILSRLPRYRAWWNSTALPFGLSASFCSINFPYLASPCFYLWISLSLSCFIFALHMRKHGAKWSKQNEGCGSFPRRLGAMQPGSNKAAGFHGGSYVYFFFFSWKTCAKFLCRVCQLWSFPSCLIHSCYYFVTQSSKTVPGWLCWLPYPLSQTFWTMDVCAFATERQSRDPFVSWTIALFWL